jgi:VanZ like family
MREGGTTAAGAPVGTAPAPRQGERLAARVTLAWAGVVLVFALLPLHGFLHETVGERESLTTQIGHFVEFAVLAALAAWWVGCRDGSTGVAAGDGRTPGAGESWTRSARGTLLAWAATVAFGAAIEVVQIPLPYRSAQLSDLLLDGAGALAGALVFSAGRGLRARAGRTRAR